ncbi:hypothetical protein BJ912DRAFT_948738 [Pholiota molesta]|nr:hypothetical protein BJ912DRAFT_948738 [Pholiota molesta]
MLNAFKIKPFDLEPIYAEWKDGPKDLPVEEWLEKIKEGCVARGVPEEYWYKAAQHFMGPKARARLDELKQVIVKVHGGKYRWTWKKFKLAMLNMGWNIDANKKETIKIQGKGSGMWFSRRKDTEPESVKANEPDPPVAESNSIWITKTPIVEEPEEVEEPLLASRMNSKEEKELPQRPGHQSAKSDTMHEGTFSSLSFRIPIIVSLIIFHIRSSDNDASAGVASEACTALDAILITAGSIPAMPAIAAALEARSCHPAQRTPLAPSPSG